MNCVRVFLQIALRLNGCNKGVTDEEKRDDNDRYSRQRKRFDVISAMYRESQQKYNGGNEKKYRTGQQ